MAPEKYVLGQEGEPKATSAGSGVLYRNSAGAREATPPGLVLGANWRLRGRNALLSLGVAALLLALAWVSGLGARWLFGEGNSSDNILLLLLGIAGMFACLLFLFFGGVCAVGAVKFLLTGRDWDPGRRVSYSCPYCFRSLLPWQAPGDGEFARCPRCGGIIRGRTA